MSKIKEYAKAYGALISSASDAEQYLGSVPTVVYDGPDQSTFRNVVQHYCKLVLKNTGFGCTYKEVDLGSDVVVYTTESNLVEKIESAPAVETPVGTTLAPEPYVYEESDEDEEVVDEEVADDEGDSGKENWF